MYNHYHLTACTFCQASLENTYFFIEIDDSGMCDHVRALILFPSKSLNQKYLKHFDMFKLSERFLSPSVLSGKVFISNLDPHVYYRLLRPKGSQISKALMSKALVSTSVSWLLRRGFCSRGSYDQDTAVLNPSHLHVNYFDMFSVIKNTTGYFVREDELRFYAQVVLLLMCIYLSLSLMMSYQVLLLVLAIIVLTCCCVEISELFLA